MAGSRLGLGFPGEELVAVEFVGEGDVVTSIAEIAKAGGGCQGPVAPVVVGVAVCLGAWACGRVVSGGAV